MRIFQSNKLGYLLLLTLVLLYCYSCTVEDIDGKRFYIASEARKYMLDTTETSFRMEDNVGIIATFQIE